MTTLRQFLATPLVMLLLLWPSGCSDDVTGPDDTYQPIHWERLDGPEGGTVHSLACTSSGVVFAGTGGGGIFRSDDGHSWTRATRGLDGDVYAQLHSDVRSIVVNADDEVFAATWYGIYSSTDNGNTWESRLDFSYASDRSLAIDNDGIIYVGSMRDLQRSTDGGETWTGLGQAPTGLRAFALNESGDIFVSTRYNLYRSTDGGTEWVSIATGLPLGSMMHLVAGSSGFLCVEVEDWENGGIFVSTDKGDSWAPSSNGPTLSVNCLRIVGDDLYVGTGGEGLFVSEDGGHNWRQLNSGLGSLRIYDVVTTGGALYTGTHDRGVLKSSDGGEAWSAVNDGLCATTILTLASSSSGYLYASAVGASMATTGTLYRSGDGGEHWEEILDGYGIISIATFPQGAVACAGFAYTPLPEFRVFWSGDSGDSWSDVTNGSEPARRLMAADDGILFMETSVRNGKIFRSADEGASWVDTGIVGKVLAQTGDGTILATTDSTVVWSTDGGVGWTPAAELPGPLMYISSAALAPGDVVWVTTSRVGIMYSRDKGLTWTEIDNCPTRSSAAGIFATQDGTIFVEDGFGTYRSDDDGKSWEPVGEELSHYDVECLAQDADGSLYAGTSGNGVMCTR